MAGSQDNQQTLAGPVGGGAKIDAAPVGADTGSTGLKEGVLHVRVVDENGVERVPKGTDAVYVAGNRFVVVGGKTVAARTKLPYEKANGFVHPLTGSGDLLLSIEYAGFESVQQRFQFEAPAKAPKLVPFWPESDRDTPANVRRTGYLLQCMKLNRAAGGMGDQRSPKVFNLTVALHPTRTYVAVIGAEIWEDGASAHPRHRTQDFASCATTFAAYLAASGTLNPSSAFLLLDCQRGRIERWDRVTGGAYRPHFVVDQRKPAPTFARGTDFAAWVEQVRRTSVAADQYLGATAIYRFLSELAKRLPSTLADLSIFSHANFAGPLLFNTSIVTDQIQKTRAVGDLDLHDNQDFIEPTVSGWRDIPQAFTRKTVAKVGSITGTIHVWSGYERADLQAMARHLLEKKKDRFPADGRELDRAGVVTALRQMLQSSFARRLATFCMGTATYAPPPGFPAEIGRIEDVKTVPAELRRRVSGPIPHPSAMTTRADLRELFQSDELGSGIFNEFGLLLYWPEGMQPGSPAGIMAR